MLLDLIAYAPLASAVLVTSLRLFFEKPNRLEIPISFPKAIPRTTMQNQVQSTRNLPSTQVTA